MCTGCGMCQPNHEERFVQRRIEGLENRIDSADQRARTAVSGIRELAEIVAKGYELDDKNVRVLIQQIDRVITLAEELGARIIQLEQKTQELQNVIDQHSDMLYPRDTY